MKDVFEIIKEFDFNNKLVVVVASVFVIVVFASCVETLWASRIEVILMSKKEQLKGQSLRYVIVFFVMAIMNYGLVSQTIYFVLSFIICVLVAILYGVLTLLNKFKKCGSFFAKVKEYLEYMLMIFFFSLLTDVLSSMTGINKISCALICALAEIVVFVLTFVERGPIESKIVLNVTEEKWYVFRRMDNCLLCGTDNKIESSKKIKLFKLDTILEGDLYFEKCE